MGSVGGREGKGKRGWRERVREAGGIIIIIIIEANAQCALPHIHWYNYVLVARNEIMRDSNCEPAFEMDPYN